MSVRPLAGRNFQQSGTPPAAGAKPKHNQRVHPALLLAVALQLEPSQPYAGETATLTVTTDGETEPLRVDVGGAAMLRRVPEGAKVERVESDLHLVWPRAPERARVELVLRADEAAWRLDVTATSGPSTATLRVEPLRREAPPMPADRVFLIGLGGFALSMLMWPTFRLMWRAFPIVGLMAAIAGTIASVVFVRMWWTDYAATADYRQGRCVITDGMLVYQGTGKRMRRYYWLMYAAELEGGPRIAGDGDRSGFLITDDEGPLAQLQRFEIGKAYPCWWSVRDRNELLLEPRRRAVRRRVFFTVVAVVLILLPGWMEAPVRRRRR